MLCHAYTRATCSILIPAPVYCESYSAPQQILLTCSFPCPKMPMQVSQHLPLLIPTYTSRPPNISSYSLDHFCTHAPICRVPSSTHCPLYPSSGPTMALSLIHSHSCPSNNTVGNALITHLHSALIRYYVRPFSLTSSV
jgi:hypothetical protein